MLTEVLKHSMMITGFVFVMMLVIEYVNVLTRGRGEDAIRRHRRTQILLASGLGAIPGCLGAFAVASLYAHRIVTFGALTASMIATCGDEAFVMLALFPRQALIIMAVLLVVGIVSGLITDALLHGRITSRPLPDYLPVHSVEEQCFCFSPREIMLQWRRFTPQRGLLTAFFALFVLGVVTGNVGHHDLGLAAEAASHHAWNWVRLTLLLAALFGLLVVVTVPEHFLEEHFWNHLVKGHVWRIFLWTIGALLVTHILLDHLHLEPLVRENRMLVLLIACLVGIIPQSGPHLLFVTLYAQGTLPFSTLLASCIVQDGHGMIPVLAHSRRAFGAVKAINLAIGFAVGALGIWMGW